MISLLLLAAAQPEPSLTKLLQRVRIDVPAARSISDVQVCPPTRISRDGKRFTVMVAFSRRTEARSYFGARWEGDRFTRLIDTGFSATDEGAAGLVSRALDRQFEDCQWISAEQLEAAWAEVDGREVVLRAD